MDVARTLPMVAAMLWRLALMLLLAGCTAGQSGPALESLTTMAAPAGGTARIVVLRPENGFFGAGDRSFGIKLDGEAMGDLMTGTFVFADRPAGQHQVAADLWDFPGVSRYDVNAAAGRTYYLVAKLHPGVNDAYAAQIVGGLAGKLIVSSASGIGGDHGAIDLMPMSEADAKKLVAGLKQAR
jgi:hypothetical protein